MRNLTQLASMPRRSYFFLLSTSVPSPDSPSFLQRRLFRFFLLSSGCLGLSLLEYGLPLTSHLILLPISIPLSSNNYPAMAPPKVFSLEGKVLKLNSAEDINAHIQPLVDNTDYTEVRFGGNTLGIAASQRLAVVLKNQTCLEAAYLDDIFTGRLLSEIPTALTALLNAILELPNVHTVNLNDNAFGLNTSAPPRRVPLPPCAPPSPHSEQQRTWSCGRNPSR